MNFQESKTLSPGETTTILETDYCKIGIGICYDIRFPQLAQHYTKQGCKMLVYPGAFNTTTGPVHWELLIRSRGLDNQLYFAAISPAKNPDISYPVWGHSTIVDPWGQVVATTDDKEDIIYADINLDYVNLVREQIPISKQRKDHIWEKNT